MLPVFSETVTVRDVVTWLRTNLGEKLCEIIIVISPRSDRESVDVCAALCHEDPRVRMYVQAANPGLGNAVREGFARVRGTLVLCMDSDGEMEIETVPRMLARIEAGYDMVIASRWSTGGGFVGYSKFKYVLNWGFQQLFRVLFRTPLHDLTYGFKMMRAEYVHSITWQGTMHEIACETTLKPLRMGARVAEVPSTWTARASGVTKNAFLRNFRYVDLALRVLLERDVALALPGDERLRPQDQTLGGVE